MKAAPLTFDAVFREIHRRRVAGGPKTTSAEEITFLGNLGAGPLLLISRVRLINPLESFLTSSNHRLRDSHVGRSGHWVDLRVVGSCSDAEIAVIERLASAADERPVVVSRTKPKRRSFRTS